MGRHIIIVNLSTVVQTDDYLNGVQAVHAQIAEDFAPDWGLSAEIVATDEDPGKGERIILFDHSDQAGALGYHGATGPTPYGKVFAVDCQQAGIPWTRALSHEAIEQIADPFCNFAALGPCGRYLALWGYELCDMVEGHGYQKAGREVSNYVLPAWFTPGIPLGPVDHMKVLTRSFSIAPGGYALVALRVGQWQQVFGEQASRAVADVRGNRRFQMRQQHENLAVGTAVAAMGGGMALNPEWWPLLWSALQKYGPSVLQLLLWFLSQSNGQPGGPPPIPGLPPLGPQGAAGGVDLDAIRSAWHRGQPTGPAVAGAH